MNSHSCKPWQLRMCLYHQLSFLLIASLVSAATVGSIQNPFLDIGNVKCWFNYECCQEPWLKQDVQGLKDYLTENLHGQHLVVDPVVRSIRGHLKYDNPKKALVLSLHGSTGTGKNFVSRAIAEHLFKNGMDSRFVHLFSVVLDFPHASKADQYQENLKQWIIGNTTECHRNLFIFDEVHEMPPGVIDAIRPFLDHHQKIGMIDYRKNIFIFLGNTAGQEINSHTLTQHLNGRSREDITLKELQPVITNSAFNEHGGLWHSRIIDHSLINIFIPFLPLERRHIEKCIHDDLIWKRISSSPELVQSVLEELEYKPNDIKIYAKSGCKAVSDKVNLMSEFFGHDEF